ncbi:GCN5-related N-acetyltransferase [Methylobacterium sp. 4-46]|uniref:GNAT family N-acetyltransferase n=1 Tax=unclassified Methylobacterium TaxID=2615210 RepID=UPI000152DF75|nr:MULTISPECIES: GNAT family N-acetyltransferase [Methylobacterium]ACA16620.1 GCN5-related N-acetyltransferase [Methylobacterium sp. 4-46]WFT82324.1 GNAT family N-acetyltransferase [Methylobacterium nodulans]
MTHSVSGAAVIRRLWPSDRAAVEAHFGRLDRETRFNRFMAAVSEAGARSYGAAALARDGLVYGAFVDGILRGVGELRPTGPAGLGPEAEAAFSVEPGYRQRGLGTALAERLCTAARHAAVGQVHLRALAGNRPLLALARRLGAEPVLSGGEAHAIVPIAPATALSHWAESLDGLIDAMLAAFQPRAAQRAA